MSGTLLEAGETTVRSSGCWRSSLAYKNSRPQTVVSEGVKDVSVMGEEAGHDGSPPRHTQWKLLEGGQESLLRRGKISLETWKTHRSCSGYRGVGCGKGGPCAEAGRGQYQGRSGWRSGAGAELEARKESGEARCGERGQGVGHEDPPRNGEDSGFSPPLSGRTLWGQEI